MERSQQTDRVEFWATVDTSRPPEELDPEVAVWQRHYNTERSHSSLGGKTPQQRLDEVADKVPTAEEVHGRFDPKREVYRTNSHHTWVLVRSPASQ